VSSLSVERDALLDVIAAQHPLLAERHGVTPRVVDENR
jgi:hypothetical protein